VNYIDYFSQLKNELQKKRGITPSSHPALGLTIPAAGWDDIMLVYGEMMEAAQLPWIVPGIERRQGPLSFEKAKKAFEEQSPYNQALRTWGFFNAPSQYMASVLRNDWYPHQYAEKFWLAAYNFAKERNSLGAIPSRWTMIKESVKETLEDRKRDAEKALNKARKETSMWWSIVGFLWDWRLPIVIGVGGAYAYTKFKPESVKRLKP